MVARVALFDGRFDHLLGLLGRYCEGEEGFRVPERSAEKLLTVDARNQVLA